MHSYRMRFWIGPVQIEEIGAKAREAGLTVLVGTEHLVIDAQGADGLDARLRVEGAMKEAHGTDFGMRLIETRGITSV